MGSIRKCQALDWSPWNFDVLFNNLIIQPLVKTHIWFQAPDFNGDPTQAQAFFLQEVQLGEELLSEGDYEGAVEHLATAVMMCGQPQQLLQILNQTLPPQVFKMLLERLPIRVSNF